MRSRSRPSSDSAIPKISQNNAQFGVYAQDDWDVTDKLMLNLGVRWDVETNRFNNDYVTPQPLRDSLRDNLGAQFFVDRPTPSGADGERPRDRPVRGLNNFVTTGRSDRPMFLGAIQPRLGGSYDLRGDGRTVLFGGFGHLLSTATTGTRFSTSSSGGSSRCCESNSTPRGRRAHARVACSGTTTTSTQHSCGRSPRVGDRGSLKSSS